MPLKDFTTDDVISICCHIAKNDNIRVEIPQKNKGGKFRRSISAEPPKAESTLARKLSVTKGIPSIFNGKAKNVSDDSSAQKQQQQSQQQIQNNNIQAFQNNVTGLGDRDVVAVAILLDDKGRPIKTYTEQQNIPGEHVDAADKIFLSHLPVQNNTPMSKQNNNDNLTPLAELLDDLDAKQSAKLVKALQKTMDHLHTTDLNTALSFLKVERYKEVRRDLKAQLLLFATKELKVIV